MSFIIGITKDRATEFTAANKINLISRRNQIIP